MPRRDGSLKMVYCLLIIVPGFLRCWTPQVGGDAESWFNEFFFFHEVIWKCNSQFFLIDKYCISRKHINKQS